MSTKSHFIYETHIEGFEETNETQSIFGKFVGFNAYLVIDQGIIMSSKLEGEYLFIETKLTKHLPKKFKIWGDAILSATWENEELTVHLKGGHFITKEIIANNYTNHLKC